MEECWKAEWLRLANEYLHIGVLKCLISENGLISDLFSCQNECKGSVWYAGINTDTGGIIDNTRNNFRMLLYSC